MIHAYVTHDFNRGKTTKNFFREEKVEKKCYFWRCKFGACSIRKGEGINKIFENQTVPNGSEGGSDFRPEIYRHPP